MYVRVFTALLAVDGTSGNIVFIDMDKGDLAKNIKILKVKKKCHLSQNNHAGLIFIGDLERDADI